MRRVGKVTLFPSARSVRERHEEVSISTERISGSTAPLVHLLKLLAKTRDSCSVRSQMTRTSYWTRSWGPEGGELRPCPSLASTDKVIIAVAGHPLAPQESASPRLDHLGEPRGGQPTARKVEASAAAAPLPTLEERLRLVIQRGFAPRGSRELPGPGSPREADPEGTSQPAAPPPGLTSQDAQNSAHANESDSLNPLLGSHLPVGSSRAAAELRAPTRPPFIHLSPTPVRGGAADQSWVRLGSGRRALLPEG